MNLKDQASKLREMMKNNNERQQGVCVPVAVLSCGNNDGLQYSELIAEKISKQQNKNVLLINTNTKQENILGLIEKPILFEKVMQQLEWALNEIDDNLNEIYKMINAKKINNTYLSLFEKIERYKEVLLYNCGNFINAKTMNLMALSSTIILVVDGTKESIDMALQVLKIQKKIQQHAEFLIIGNDLDESDLGAIIHYLKKESKFIMENLIKGVSGVSLEKLIAGDKTEMAKWGAISIPLSEQTRTLSSRLKFIL